MKKSNILVIILFYCFGCVSQPGTPRGEFATNANGLMYSDADMKSLRFIVDSLNLRFKTCDLTKNFYSVPQAKEYYVSFKSENNNLKQVIAAIKANPSFRDLTIKYKEFISTVDTNLIIVRHNNLEIKEGKYYFLEGKPSDGYETAYFEDNSLSNEDISGKWVYEYSEKDKKDKDDYYHLACRFFPSSFRSQVIPDKYCQLIQYVDCMIDTTAVVFLTDQYTGGWLRKDDLKAYNNLQGLSDYINTLMKMEKSKGKVIKLSADQISFAKNNLTGDESYKALLGKTINDYAANNSFSFQLEELAGSAGMFDKELLMKRCYRVMGNCSQDESPRRHARDIAILAGKSHSWDIFLRAHLDIMNDRFERVSDGSYAWHNRKTYLKELEELNLDIVDLMLGLTFRAANTAPNHYFGTVWRLGWALTESREKKNFETKAISIIKDEQLDEFNRGLVFLLYRSYIQHLDEKEKNEKINWLKENIDGFPFSIKNSIEEFESPGQRKRGR